MKGVRLQTDGKVWEPIIAIAMLGIKLKPRKMAGNP